MEDMPAMSNCPLDLKVSNVLSEKRLKKAFNVLGVRVVNRILGFALFLLGAKREDISQYLNMPYGTFLSFLTRVDHYGLFAFDDRRKLPELPPAREKPLEISLKVKDQYLFIQLGCENQVLKIPYDNSLQCKVVLLTFLNNGLLITKDVAKTLGCSERYVRQLNTKLLNEDACSIIGKQKGQLQDYKFSPEVKAELIQQFAVNAITEQPTSSRIITTHLNQRCNFNLSDRGIRLHIKKLGLSRIKNTLPKFVEQLKKTSL